MRYERQVLVFDADDTLWENNVLFERVIGEFLDWVEQPGRDRGQVRAVLDGIQAANARVHGYGSGMLLRSLVDCVERLYGRAATARERGEVTAMAAVLLDARVELIPGVAETLEVLGGRHELLLLTKGDPQEQRRKLDASQLAHHFRAVGIVAEKNSETYRHFARTHALTPASSWMIGNSPKSDILPARQAGMNAVFIPHEHTWVLEHGELDPQDQGVLRLPAFSQLLEHF